MLQERHRNLQELLVVDFQAEHETAEHVSWKNRKLGSQIPYAEKCARNIWYGYEEDFLDFPEPAFHDKYRKLKGHEAYAHLLCFMLGVVNPIGYDAPAVHRFFEAWSKINNRSPVHSKKYSGLIHSLAEDYRFMRTNCLCRTKVR